LWREIKSIFCSKNQTSLKVSCVSHTPVTCMILGCGHPYYIAANEMVIRELRTVKGLEESCHGLIWRYFLPGICLEGLRKTMKTSVRTACLQADIWTWDTSRIQSREVNRTYIKLILQHYHKYLYIKELEFQIWRCKPKAVQIYAARCLLWLPD
jgi:hypothetical protein